MSTKTTGTNFAATSKNRSMYGADATLQLRGETTAATSVYGGIETHTTPYNMNGTAET
jgi:hypothetical protein